MSLTEDERRVEQQKAEARQHCERDYFRHESLPSRRYSRSSASTLSRGRVVSGGGSGAVKGDDGRTMMASEFLSTKGKHVVGNCNRADVDLEDKFVPLTYRKLRQQQQQVPKADGGVVVDEQKGGGGGGDGTTGKKVEGARKRPRVDV